MILLEFLYCLSALQLSPVLYSTLPRDVRLPLTLHVSFKIKIISENIRYVKGNTQHGVVSLPILLHPLSPPATVVICSSIIFLEGREVLLSLIPVSNVELVCVQAL